ncbi:hypothetical protein EG19_09380 [Thermoanaerobaculum aquaticum]|uniref:Uncharacterized protein n=1 Tax=Thermoanaerobaculum aquaticum TaxID=1312852 RepID=A0A062XU35_9BACT|nr:hypothetical protein EG19_09380 [Thermoanaerobaculum aquaticum]
MDLFAPLDALRAFTWEKLWIKHPEDPALDELILRGSVLVVWSDYYVGEEHKGPLWFYLGRTGDCPAETVLVARWVEMGQTSRDPESEYREALEEILRTSRVTELACKTGGLSELNALAEAIDDLTFPATLKCDDYLYRPGERLPAFVFRLFGGGGRSTKMLGGVDCGEGEAHGNLLAWYARAMKVLAKLRKAVEEERLPWGWCSLATEDGLTFLEKRPPHSPIDWEVDLWRGLTWEPAKP